MLQFFAVSLIAAKGSVAIIEQRGLAIVVMIASSCLLLSSIICIRCRKRHETKVHKFSSGKTPGIRGTIEEAEQQHTETNDRESRRHLSDLPSPPRMSFKLNLIGGEEEQKDIGASQQPQDVVHLPPIHQGLHEQSPVANNGSEKDSASAHTESPSSSLVSTPFESQEFPLADIPAPASQTSFTSTPDFEDVNQWFSECVLQVSSNRGASAAVIAALDASKLADTSAPDQVTGVVNEKSGPWQLEDDVIETAFFCAPFDEDTGWGDEKEAPDSEKLSIAAPSTLAHTSTSVVFTPPGQVEEVVNTNRSPLRSSTLISDHVKIAFDFTQTPNRPMFSSLIEDIEIRAEDEF